MTWVRFEPKAKMRVLKNIFPEGIHIPDFFFGKVSRILRRTAAAGLLVQCLWKIASSNTASRR